MNDKNCAKLLSPLSSRWRLPSFLAQRAVSLPLVKHFPLHDIKRPIYHSKQLRDVKRHKKHEKIKAKKVFLPSRLAGNELKGKQCGGEHFIIIARRAAKGKSSLGCVERSAPSCSETHVSLFPARPPWDDLGAL